MSDEDRIARVARALCVADGNDPEADHTVHEFDQDRIAIRESIVPRWTAYAGEARRMIAAMVAVGVLD